MLLSSEVSCFWAFCFFMKLKLIFWNVRGLNDPKKRGILRNWLRKWKVDVVYLQETKLDKVDWRIIQSIWGNRFVAWVAPDAINMARGVLLLWDKRVLELADSIVGKFSVSCFWKDLLDGFEWVGMGLYGPTHEEFCPDFWSEVKGVRQRWAQPWCVFGDFNVVRFPSERLGCSRLSSTMIDFSDFIEDLSLVNLPLHGGRYTWCNGLSNSSMSWIDRVLVSTD